MRRRARRRRGLLVGVALLLSLGLSAVAEAQGAGTEQSLVCEYRPVRHEVVDGVDISVIERVAPLRDAAGHRVTVWIDDGERRVWKIELQDGRGRLLYTVRYLRYERRGGEWRAAAVYVLDQSSSEAKVVRELEEVAGISLDDVRSAAVGCAGLN